MGCKYVSGNNLPRIKLIRGKLFPDWYLQKPIRGKLFPDRYLQKLIHGKLFTDRYLLPAAAFISVALLFSVALVVVVSANRCGIVTLQKLSSSKR